MRKIEKNPNFNYILMCNKICGGAHYKMKMMVVVKSESDYKSWIAAKSKETFKDKYFPAPAAAPVATTVPADTTMKVVNN
jgi:cytochrome c oxidase subunit 2